jgi:hypothetical protein
MFWEQWTKLQELPMDTKYPVRSQITLMTNRLRTLFCLIRSQKAGPALTKGGVAIIVALLALLVAAVALVVHVWRATDVEIPAYGWAALAAGSFFSVLVGGGLMALVFYSSRAGYDEPPRFIDNDH